MSLKILYRYVDYSDFSHFTVLREEFEVIKETPMGYWFLPKWAAQIMTEDSKKRNCRWVSKTARKRYCYPTMKEAWNSYVIRKRSHLDRLQDQLDQVTARVNAINARDDDDIPAGKEVRLAPHDITLI